MIRLLTLLCCLLASPAWASCRQALALGLDVSASVDSQEYELQLNGLASALAHPQVTALLVADAAAPVRLAIFEWSESSHQRMLLHWTEIRNAKDLQTVIGTVLNVERTPAPEGTALGSAMAFGASLLAEQPDCWKRTLDLSGDGKQNVGPHPRDVRQSLSASGITINGLVIGADDPNRSDQHYVQVSDLSAYFNAWVILGPDAFVEVALGFETYAEAMTRKLIRELQGVAVSALRPYQ